jgi:hypothetical protein|tara:strand:+ start:121 stop:441 length:321 start_codon:yes stop_codon:yes gene_type:complete
MPVLGTQVIKSIQRGTTVLAAGGSTNVTINSVDTDKSFLSSSVASGYGAGNLSSSSSDGNAANAFTMGGFISGAAQLSFAAGTYKAYNTSYATSSTQIYWEVIEYV